MRQLGAGLLDQFNFADSVHQGEFLAAHAVNAFISAMMRRAESGCPVMGGSRHTRARALVVDFCGAFAIAKETTQCAT